MESQEMPQADKNQSAIRRVIGVPKEKEEKIKAIFAERFSKHDIPEFKKLGITELEKSPKQIEIIKYADDLTNEISKKYGGQELKIPPDKVYILKEEDFNKFYKYKNFILNDTTTGYYAPGLQAVILKEYPLFLDFALNTVDHELHEKTHFKAYQTTRYPKAKGLFRFLRGGKFDFGQIGIKVTGKTPEIEYFENLDEAVTEELTKRTITKEILNEDVLQAKNPKLFELIKEEIEELKKARQMLRILKIIKREEKVDIDPNEILSFKIKTENMPSLDGSEAESLFTGKLRWAHLVTESFGVGTLQGLAKADKNVDELEKFVDGLKV